MRKTHENSEEDPSGRILPKVATESGLLLAFEGVMSVM